MWVKLCKNINFSCKNNNSHTLLILFVFIFFVVHYFILFWISWWEAMKESRYHCSKLMDLKALELFSLPLSRYILVTWFIFASKNWEFLKLDYAVIWFQIWQYWRVAKGDNLMIRYIFLIVQYHTFEFLTSRGVCLNFFFSFALKIFSSFTWLFVFFTFFFLLFFFHLSTLSSDINITNIFFSFFYGRVSYTCIMCCVCVMSGLVYIFPISKYKIINKY